MEGEFNSQIRYERLNVSLDKKLLKGFKYWANSDKTNPNKLIGQFMRNYVDYLDKSFVEKPDAEIPQKGNVSLLLYVPSDVYLSFGEKIEREGIKTEKGDPSIRRKLRWVHVRCKRKRRLIQKRRGLLRKRCRRPSMKYPSNRGIFCR